MNSGDATSTPIDAILRDVNAQLPPVGPPPGLMTQEHAVAVAPTMNDAKTTAWVSRLARNLVTFTLVFASVFAVSVPMFQDFVLCWIPKAVTPSGTLSLTGAFFKALAGTGAFIILHGMF